MLLVSRPMSAQNLPSQPAIGESGASRRDGDAGGLSGRLFHNNESLSRVRASSLQAPKLPHVPGDNERDEFRKRPGSMIRACCASEGLWA